MRTVRLRIEQGTLSRAHLRHVLLMRPKMEMLNINAESIITRMADLKTIRDGAIGPLVGMSVRKKTVATDAYTSISLSRTQPEQTTAVGFWDGHSLKPPI